MEGTRVMHASFAAAVMLVSDLDAALRYYLEVLGFAESFRHGDYAGSASARCNCTCVRTATTDARPVAVACTCSATRWTSISRN